VIKKEQGKPYLEFLKESLQKDEDLRKNEVVAGWIRESMKWPDDLPNALDCLVMLNEPIEAKPEY